eukprot:s451_g12.t1
MLHPAARTYLMVKDVKKSVGWSCCSCMQTVASAAMNTATFLSALYYVKLSRLWQLKGPWRGQNGPEHVPCLGARSAPGELPSSQHTCPSISAFEQTKSSSDSLVFTAMESEK